MSGQHAQVTRQPQKERNIIMEYKNLLSEGTIGNLTIRNRSVMAAMDVSMANFDGTPSDELIAFYEARAKGGVGLIINGITRIDDEVGRASLRQLSLTSDEQIPAFQKMTDAVHAYGTKMFCQLHHPGRETMCALNGDKMVVSASAQACGFCCQTTRALSTQEVKDMEEKFISSAVRAKKGGYDGVELHCAHGYLLQQFLSPYTNHRTDEYGGTMENRMRIVKNILLGIKERCGADYPVSVRISAEEFLEAVGNPAPCLTLEETVPMCVEFEKLGADVINVSAGLYETANCTVEPSSMQEGWRAYLIKAVKDAVQIPVMGVSIIRHPEFAEKLLADGNQDFICMGRTFLADPEWVKKIEEGREGEIRKCISCLHCFESYLDAIGTGKTIECTICPETAHETETLKKDGEGRVVAVAGAGAAGMEAARVLAERGFKPVVFEKEDCVGGQMNIADKPFMKYRVTEFTETMKQQLESLGVEVRLNTEATVDTLKELAPYAVIVATGGTPLVPTFIPGADGENVYTGNDILTGKVSLEGKRVAVLGGGNTGLETAEFLAQKSNQVTVIEMAPKVGPGMYAQNILDLTGRLAASGVRMLTNHKVEKIENGRIDMQNLASLQRTFIEADSVVVALGTRSVNGLEAQLKDVVEHVVLVGDASHAGRICDATRSAYLAASSL